MNVVMVKGFAIGLVLWIHALPREERQDTFLVFHRYLVSDKLLGGGQQTVFDAEGLVEDGESHR